MPSTGRRSLEKGFARSGKAVFQAMTREPGDLPATRSLLLWSRDGRGTVFRLSDEVYAAGAASARGAGDL